MHSRLALAVALSLATVVTTGLTRLHADPKPPIVGPNSLPPGVPPPCPRGCFVGQ